MSRKQYRPPTSTHEKKKSRKERRKETIQQAPVEEVTPTEDDKVQLKNLTLYSIIGIVLLMVLMYWIFITN
ncbi:MAG: hypothetical protein GY810_30530 [Aureispira sp.]|nr:hypothetical protein [Aureispira sp.]